MGGSRAAADPQERPRARPYTGCVAKKVLILGSTGSIGEQALDVVGASDELLLVGLSAGHRWERLCEQALEHGVADVALSRPEAAERAAA